MREIIIVLGFFVAIHSAPVDVQTIASAQEVPAYAKWGRLAIKETHSKYPNANIVDYLHEGKETKGDSTLERFKLWLKEGDHEFGVFVIIEYKTETEEVVNIELQETSK